MLDLRRLPSLPRRESEHVPLDIYADLCLVPNSCLRTSIISITKVNGLKERRESLSARGRAALNPLHSAPYALITQAFSLIEGTTKRIEKTAYLTSLLYTIIRRSQTEGDKEPDVQSVLQTVYLCINRLSPDYIGIELGIGESLLIKAISESTGRSNANIKADLKEVGDLGLVAMVRT